MRKNINFSSNGAYNFDVFDPPHYTASKAVMDTPIKDLARRYATEKIAVNSIAPAMTETPLFGVLTKDSYKNTIAAMPHGRDMRAESVVEWARFLASPTGDVCDVSILSLGRDVR